MTASLSSFQSIIQLGAGTNLAIFALPKLGTTEMEVEKQRWASTLKAAELKASDRIQPLKGLAEFRNDMLDIEDKAGKIKVSALIVSALSAGYLLWMASYPDDPPDAYTLGMIIITALPPLAMLYNYSAARARLTNSRRHRLDLTESKP